MAYIRIFNPPNVTADVYDRVNAEAGVDRDPPAGLLFHCAGEVNGKWQIVDIWESREQARSFYEGPLPAAIEAVVGMPPQDPPVSIEYELHTLIRP